MDRFIISRRRSADWNGKAIAILGLMLVVAVCQSCKSNAGVLNIGNRYSAGIKDGVWTEVDSTGMIHIVKYEQGEESEEYAVIDLNRPGSKRGGDREDWNRERNGRRKGIWIEKRQDEDPEEEVVEICEYRRGKKHGKYVMILYPENEIVEKGEYRNGKRHGWCRFYLGNGSLIRANKYRKGDVIQRVMANPRYL